MKPIKITSGYVVTLSNESFMKVNEIRYGDDIKNYYCTNTQVADTHYDMMVMSNFMSFIFKVKVKMIVCF